MKQRTMLTSLILTIALVPIAGPAPAGAADDPPAAIRSVPTLDRTPVAVEATMAPERQREIYRILRGGAVELDASLSRHLWQLAESLAVANWEPPKVTLRVVVSQPADRD